MVDRDEDILLCRSKPALYTAGKMANYSRMDKNCSDTLKKGREKMQACHIVSYFVEKVMPYISW